MTTTRNILLTTTTYRVQCPHEGCASNSDITHLVERLRKEGKTQHLLGEHGWPNCHLHEIRFKGMLTLVNDTPTVEGEWTPMAKKDVSTDALIILKSTNADGADPIYMFLIDNHYSKYGDPEEEIGHKEYYYNEHTCPTNWLRGVRCVIHNQDNDPHGVFEVHEVVTAEQFLLLTDVTLADYVAQRCKNEHHVAVSLIPEAFGLPRRPLIGEVVQKRLT